MLKTDADLRATLAPKVGGLHVLLDLLGTEALELVVLMSSVNAVLGAAGVADYAAANALLVAFAESPRVPAGWRQVVCLDWGAWREVGMAAKLEVPAERRAAWQAYLQIAISTDEGLDLFERVLASGAQRRVVVPYDIEAALAHVRRSGAPVAAPGSGRKSGTVDDPPADTVSSSGCSSPSGTGLEAPTGDIEQRLAAIWMELLGVERVAAHDDFFALGGHSLLATRVLARIDETMGARLALRDMFDAPTLRALAERIGAAGMHDDDREELEF